MIVIPFLRIASRVVLSAVFLWAGWAKIYDPAAFVREVENYRLIGGLLARLTAVYLPWLEVLMGLALWMPNLRRGAAWLALWLMLAFTVALGLAWWRGLDISCGCFGSAAPGASNLPLLMVRDLLLAAAAALLTARERHPAERRTR